MSNSKKVKAMKGKYVHVVPWRNPDQLCKVYNCLYSSSLNDRRWAVDQIAVWETRCHPSMPTSVEATVRLVSASIQDFLFQAEKTFCQERDIEMLYAMAIVRFINLMVETDQTAANKISISSLAAKRNIPSMIVNLRHSITHSYCPSLSMLRMGAQEALDHLERAFWKPEMANISNIINTPLPEKDTFTILIDQYQSLQFTILEQEDESRVSHKDLKHVIKDMQSALKSSKLQRTFLEALVQPGAFICVQNVVRLLHTTDVVFLEHDDDMTLPEAMEQFWFPLIKMIHKADLLLSFIEQLLVNQASHRVSICHKVAVAWAMKILLATSVYAPESPLSEMLRKKGLLLDLHRLLYACLKGANSYTLHLFNMIVNKSKNKTWYTDLFLGLTLYQGMLVNEEPKTSGLTSAQPKDCIIFSVDDVEEDLMEERTRIKRFKSSNVWSMAPVSMSFAHLPLGAIIHPVVDDAENAAAECTAEVADTEPEEEKFIIESTFNTTEEKFPQECPMDQGCDFNNYEQFDMGYKRRSEKTPP